MNGFSFWLEVQESWIYWSVVQESWISHFQAGLAVLMAPDVSPAIQPQLYAFLGCTQAGDQASPKTHWIFS